MHWCTYKQKFLFESQKWKPYGGARGNEKGSPKSNELACMAPKISVPKSVSTQVILDTWTTGYVILRAATQSHLDSVSGNQNYTKLYVIKMWAKQCLWEAKKASVSCVVYLLSELTLCLELVTVEFSHDTHRNQRSPHEQALGDNGEQDMPFLLPSWCSVWKTEGRHSRCCSFKRSLLCQWFCLSRWMFCQLTRYLLWHLHCMFPSSKFNEATWKPLVSNTQRCFLLDTHTRTHKPKPRFMCMLVSSHR